VAANGNKLARIDGPFYRNSKTRVASVTDGLSNTIFVGGNFVSVQSGVKHSTGFAALNSTGSPL